MSMVTEGPWFPLKIGLHGDQLTLSVPERNISTEELLRLRSAMFRKVRNCGCIPEAIIKLVEENQAETQVDVLCFKENVPGQSSPGMSFTAKSSDSATSVPAGEALAFFLRIRLSELKTAEKARVGAPVRQFNLMPRSLIAEMAYHLLEFCFCSACAPGRQLVTLVYELLDLEGHRQGLGLSRRIDAKARAAEFLAEHPKIGTAEMARTFGVHKSTISRWRKDAVFQKEVERLRTQTALLGG